MRHVAVIGTATPQVVAAIVAALRVRARTGADATPPPTSAWRRAARREATRAARP